MEPTMDYWRIFHSQTEAASAVDHGIQSCFHRTSPLGGIVTTAANDSTELFNEVSQAKDRPQKKYEDSFDRHRTDSPRWLFIHAWIHRRCGDYPLPHGRRPRWGVGWDGSNRWCN